MATYLYQMLDLLNGRTPDVSTGYLPPGAAVCSTDCGLDDCTFGSDYLSGSPSGPMEFARGTSGQYPGCESASGYVCGGGNYFWNRIPY